MDTLIQEAAVTEQNLRDLIGENFGWDEVNNAAIDGADMIRRLREALAEARRK